LYTLTVAELALVLYHRRRKNKRHHHTQSDAAALNRATVPIVESSAGPKLTSQQADPLCQRAMRRDQILMRWTTTLYPHRRDPVCRGGLLC